MGPMEINNEINKYERSKKEQRGGKRKSFLKKFTYAFKRVEALRISVHPKNFSNRCVSASISSPVPPERSTVAEEADDDKDRSLLRLTGVGV